MCGNKQSLTGSRCNLARSIFLARLLLIFAYPLRLQSAEPPTDRNLTPAAQNLPPSCLTHILEAFNRMTNLVASVDIHTVDRRDSTAAPTLAKETWHFMRLGPTNLFTRIRYLPFAGQERIESTNYSGGKLLNGKSAVLPRTVSLPGFELYNWIEAMVSAATLSEKREGDTTVVSATLALSEKQKVFFAPHSILPDRIEKWVGNELALVYTRAGGQTEGQILPTSDVIEFYEAGKLTVTVIRSFSNVQVFSGPISDPAIQTKPSN